jgi:hypothetical protein
MEKAWILIIKNNSYFWVDQDKIPMDKLSQIKIQEHEDKQTKLQEKLLDLEHNKN